MISSTRHIVKRNKRWISIVTCIDRSVFPTEPWEQMDTASKTLLSKTNHPTLSISQIPYCDTNNALVLPKDATVLTNCESLVIGSRDEPLLKQLRYLQEFPMLNLDRRNCGRDLHGLFISRDENDQNAYRPRYDWLSSTLKLTKGFHNHDFCPFCMKPYENKVEIDPLGDVAGQFFYNSG